MIHQIHGLVWGPGLLMLLLTVGTFYTIRSGGFQVLGFPVWWKATIGSLMGERGRKGASEPGEDVPGADEPGRHSVTRIQAACTALAATIGTGNIVGVATALTAGGPGAIFWMWVSAAIGMMTAYGETCLGIVYRYRNSQGRWICGPAVYISRGLHMPLLGLIYGCLCLMASLGMGSMVQSNAIAQTLQFSVGIPALPCAVAVTVLVLGVTAGGIGRVARVTERMIPVSAGVYIAFSMVVLVFCRKQIPGAFSEIFRYALLPQSVLGGIGGYGIRQGFRYGIARGVFSNEAGLGSLAGLHGATEDTTPQEQGMWAMFEVFFDTVVICTMTALVILCVAGGSEGLARGDYDGAVLTAYCFQKVLGAAGEYLIGAAMVIFAFATMIAWYFLGRQTLEAVLELLGTMTKGKKGCSWRRLWRKWAEYGYLAAFGYAVFLGCTSNLTTVWELSDIWNGLMAFPNILALFFLHRKVSCPSKRFWKYED